MAASKPAAFSQNPIASEPPASRLVPLPYPGAYPVTIEAVGGVEPIDSSVAVDPVPAPIEIAPLAAEKASKPID